MNTEMMAMPGSPVFEVENTAAVSGNTSPAAWLLDALMYPGQSDAGTVVNGYTALQHAPIWQGVNVIAGDIGQIPTRLVRDEFDDQKDHPAWRLLRLQPNTFQTPSVWKETMIQWALIWGNGVSWVIRRGSRPVEVVPLRPDCLSYELLGYEGSQYVVYRYWSPTSHREYVFLQDEVIHLQGLTGDGVWGHPLWQIARNTIGHGLALEKHGNRQFRGVHPGGILKLDQANYTSKEARENLRADIERMHAGPDNAGRMMILRDVWDFQANQPINNTDAEWISARKLDRQMAASLLNLPGWKLNATEDSSVRANLEETNADYIQRTLNRWFTRFGEELSRKLLTTAEFNSDRYQFKWDVSEVLKADIDTLSAVVDRLVKATIINPNEGRRMLGLPPYKGGELYGSPAINPRDPVAPESASNEPDAGEKVNSSHRRMVLGGLSSVIAKEYSSLKDAAKRPQQFLAWLDKYYLGGGETDSRLLNLAKSLMGREVNACESIGLPMGGIYVALTEYARKRHSVLLKTAELATADTLATNVELAVAGEPESVASGLLTTVLGVS